MLVKGMTSEIDEAENKQGKKKELITIIHPFSMQVA